MGSFSFMEEGAYRFRSVEEGKVLATLLANAVEHGNLGITYDDKSRLMERPSWAQEIERRLALPENSRKRVRFEVAREALAGNYGFPTGDVETPSSSAPQARPA